MIEMYDFNSARWRNLV